ncbi:MAG: hypothetical protein GWP61_10135 [Chloroflexi bacterium]|nr:hypothetical protein [Chloroflexota bacterium]
MSRIIMYILALLVIVHGAIHLMGFVAYWPLAEMKELPYKTMLLVGRWDVGVSGMRVYSLLWLATAVLFIAAAIGLILRQEWWWPLMWAAVLLSLLVCILDWQNAFRGAIISGVILVVLFLLLGLRIQPAPLAAYPGRPETVETLPVPGDLPAPVARYYETVMGDEMPLIETAVLSGRGTLRFNGITFPAQFRLLHDVGHDYRQIFTATYFGRPLMTADETYIDGHAVLNTPVGVIENDPQVDSAANLALWGLAMMMPSAYLTDSRVRWEAVDQQSARLIIPDGAEEDNFTVTFDPDTGLIAGMDTMRYFDVQQGKKAWHLEGHEWQQVQGVLIPTKWTVTWLDEGSPWLVGTVEDVLYNVQVADTIRENLQN